MYKYKRVYRNEYPMRYELMRELQREYYRHRKNRMTEFRKLLVYVVIVELFVLALLYR